MALSKGTLDMLMEAGWIKPQRPSRDARPPGDLGARPRRSSPHFGLDELDDLPGIDELKAAGLLDKRPSIQITDAALPVEEEPLSPEEQEKLAEDAAFLASIDGETSSGAAAGEGDAGASDEPAGGHGPRDDDSVAEAAARSPRQRTRWTSRTTTRRRTGRCRTDDAVLDADDDAADGDG